MLKSYDGMSEQLINGSYRPVLFTIYNMAEEDGYIRRLGNIGIDVSVGDLDFIKIEIDKEMSAQIKKGERNTMAHMFKSYIEEELQGEKTILEVLISKEFGAVFVIKPKDYGIEDFLNNIKK